MASTFSGVFEVCMYVCIVYDIKQSMDQLVKVVNPARGQLNISSLLVRA